jgi:hypothetical protein
MQLAAANAEENPSIILFSWKTLSSLAMSKTNAVTPRGSLSRHCTEYLARRDRRLWLEMEFLDLGWGAD